VTTLQLPALSRETYLRAASALTVVNGFRKTGIWPINCDAFHDSDDYAASLPTDIPVLEHATTGRSTDLIVGEVSAIGQYVDLIVEESDGTIGLLWFFRYQCCTQSQ